MKWKGGSKSQEKLLTSFMDAPTLFAHYATYSWWDC